MTCLPLLIAFSSLHDINTILRIGITITWSVTLHYAIFTTSLWCWKDISYNDVTSISILHRSISRRKSNKKPMSPQYRVPTGIEELMTHCKLPRRKSIFFFFPVCCIIFNCSWQLTFDKKQKRKYKTHWFSNWWSFIRPESFL